MNQELNVSLELSTFAANDQDLATLAAPIVLDEALLAQIGGGISPCGPNSTW
jgi:hypothetical protein